MKGGKKMLIDWSLSCQIVNKKAGEVALTFVARPCDADPESDAPLTDEEIDALAAKAVNALNTWAHVDRVVISQSFGTVEAGASVVGVKIGRIG